MGHIIKQDLNGKWFLKTFDQGEGERGEAFNADSPDGWMEATVPGVVHLDLMKANKIGDPFYRLNELDVAWVEEKDWWYRREFDAPQELVSKESVELVFYGLDTFATIWLNGQEIGKANNMFIPWRFDAKRALKPGTNLLVVKLSSPVHVLNQLEEEKGKLVAANYSGRSYGRKAQYSFGWDWGPRFATSGIWRGVELRGYDTAIIRYVMARTDSLTTSVAKLHLEAEISSLKKADAELVFDISIQDERFSRTVSRKLNPGENLVQINLEVANPRLWWPAGYGQQLLYDFKVTLRSANDELDSITNRIGLRKADLVQEDDREGKSFIFRINGVPIFCKGANWIPADSFLPRVTKKDYDELLDMAVNAHMNMLRVWGGGIYESDLFYQMCDEKGLLIWQDFMFACAEYPEEEWFWDLVKKEAEETVKRTRNHPSIVIWCGNNENHWFLKAGRFKKKKFYGETIYHRILPDICSRLDPTRPYWPSSPYGGDDPNSQTTGDRHNWDVWANWADYTAYQDDKGRFISEFGLQAPPVMKTIESFTEPQDRWSQSKVIEHHNKMASGTERLYRYLTGHFRIPTSFKDFVLLTQVNQGEALKCGIEQWRRRKFWTSGALFWQLNDCWPVTSWSVIDYFKRPKAAYYFVRRAFNPVLVSLVKQEEKVNAFVINDTLKDVQGNLVLKFQDPDGKTSFSKTMEINIFANSSSLVHSQDLSELRTENIAQGFFYAELLVNGELVSDNTLFLERFKHIDLPKPDLQVELKKADTDGKAFLVQVLSPKFAKAVHLSLPGIQANYGDNYFDLLPATKRSVLITLGEKAELEDLRKLLVVACVVS